MSMAVNVRASRNIFFTYHTSVNKRNADKSKPACILLFLYYPHFCLNKRRYEYHFIFIKYKIQMVFNMNQGILIAISVETDIGGMNKKGLKRMELIQT